MGQEKLDSFARLFVVPQANHGLSGTSYTVDGDGKTVQSFPVAGAYERISVLQDWVEKNIAPAMTLTVSAGDRTMPLCSYPSYPKYTGGQANKAASYVLDAVVRALPYQRSVRWRIQRMKTSIITLIVGAALCVTVVTAAQGERRSIRVNGVNLSYLHWGREEAQPVLLIAGAGTVSAAWELVGPGLADRYSVYAFDVRGRGYSDWDPKHEYSVMTNVNDLKQAVKQLGLKNIIVLGHSQGGNEAVTYASGDANVAALIAAGGGIMLDGDTAPAEARNRQRSATAAAAAEDGVLQLGGSARLAAGDIPGVLADGSRESVQEDRGRQVCSSQRSGYGSLIGSGPMMQPGATEELAKRVVCPTMIIRGANDTSFKAPNADKLASLIKDMRLVRIVSGAPHGVFREKPAEFLAAVNGFLLFVAPAKK